MTEFKVGDRVRLRKPYGGTGAGAEGTVILVDGRLLRVDSLVAYHGGICASRFELADPRKDSPRAGDTVRVVLEGKVDGVDDLFFCIGKSKANGNAISPEAPHVKSIEIIEKAKPSVKGLALGSVVKAAGSVYQKYGADEWSTMGEEYSTPDADIDEMGWTLLVEQSNG